MRHTRESPISFTAHPNSVGETYGEHFGRATSFGLDLVCAGIACVLHAVFPFLFERTASDTVLRLHQVMTRRRMQGAPLAGDHDWGEAQLGEHI